MPKSKSPEKKTKSKPKSKSPAYGTPEQDIGDLSFDYSFDYLFKPVKKVPDTPERPKTKTEIRQEQINNRIRKNPHMFPGIMEKESEIGRLIPLENDARSSRFTVEYPAWAKNNKGGKTKKRKNNNKTKKRK